MKKDYCFDCGLKSEEVHKALVAVGFRPMFNGVNHEHKFLYPDLDQLSITWSGLLTDYDREETYIVIDAETILETDWLKENLSVYLI